MAALLFSTPALAVRVVAVNHERQEIIIAQEKETPWVVGDDVCVKRPRNVTSCGRVVSATAEHAIVKLTLSGKGVQIVRKKEPETIGSQAKEPEAKSPEAKAPGERGTAAAEPEPPPIELAPEPPEIPTPAAEIPSREPQRKSRSRRKPRRLEPSSVPPPASPTSALGTRTLIVPNPMPFAAPPPVAKPPPPAPIAKPAPTPTPVPQVVPPSPSHMIPGPMAILPRAGASVPAASETKVESAAELSSLHLSLGVGAGFDYFFPELHLQLRASRKVSVGLMPFYSVGKSGDTDVKAVGTVATFTYHSSGEPFLGFLWQTGLGYYSITGEKNGDRFYGSSVALYGLAGWRGEVPLGLTLFAGAGGQYAHRTTGDSSRIDFSGLRPYFAFELGRAF